MKNKRAMCEKTDIEGWGDFNLSLPNGSTVHVLDQPLRGQLFQC